MNGGKVESIGNSTVVGSMTEQRLRSRARSRATASKNRFSSPQERGTFEISSISLHFSSIELRGNDND